MMPRVPTGRWSTDVRRHHIMANGIRELGQQRRVAGRVNDFEPVALLPEREFGKEGFRSFWRSSE